MEFVNIAIAKSYSQISSKSPCFHLRHLLLLQDPDSNNIVRSRSLFIKVHQTMKCGKIQELCVITGYWHLKRTDYLR